MIKHKKYSPRVKAIKDPKLTRFKKTAKWKLRDAVELCCQHGIDVEAELAAILTQEILREKPTYTWAELVASESALQLAKAITQRQERQVNIEQWAATLVNDVKDAND